ncbi:MAG: hypothetical protein ACLFUC_05020 [Bacteroidales bacterium]
MKRNIIIFKLTALLALLLTCEIHSQTFTESKHVEKKFRLGKNTTVDITNKYGKVHVSTWEKDSVLFRIDLLVKSSSIEKLESTFESIDFDFSKTEYYVLAKTIIQSKTGGIISEIVNLAESMFTQTNHITIDYHVTLPDDISLKIENKYGDIYIDDYKGNFTLTLSNGDLKAGNLTGRSIIDLSFGDGIITSIDKCKMSISYGDLSIRQVEDLQVNSKSSKITLETVEFINMDSKRDKYNMHNVGKIFGDTYFSDIMLFNINREISLDMKYGLLSVDEINKNFSLVNLNTEYTDVNIYLKPQSSYYLDVTHGKEVNLRYPRVDNIQEKKISDDDKYLTYGNIGTPGAKAKIKIMAREKGSINIIHK